MVGSTNPASDQKMLVKQLRFRRILLGVILGVVASVILAVGPSLMILRSIAMLNWQVAVLWSIELFACVALCIYLPAIRTRLTSILVGSSFFFLYSALAILCWKVNAGIIGRDEIKIAGLSLCFISLILLYLSFRYSTTQSSARLFARPAVLLLCGIGFLLAGVSLTYAAWVPLLAVPGGVVLAKIGLIDSPSGIQNGEQ